MFLPQYSIRTIFLVMGLVGVVSAFGSLAVRGYSWAIGLVVGVAAVVAFFLASACMYLLALRLIIPMLSPPEVHTARPEAEETPT